MGCGEPIIADNPFAGSVSGTPPQPIDFDERRVEVTTDLIFGAPNVVLGGAGVEVCNESTGSRVRTGLSVTGSSVDPNQLGVGPTFGWGGLSIGLLASGVFAGNPSFTPQVGIGGVTYSPMTGVCSGLWCVGTGGPTLLPPPAIAIIGISQVIGDALQVERENAEAFPLLVASDLVSNILPFRQIGEALNVVGVGTGTGPSPRKIQTVEELTAYRVEIERTVESGRWTDAQRSLEGTLHQTGNPFVRADLTELLDRASFEENKRGISSESIEGRIRRAVDAMEEFSAKYAEWLRTGAGSTPGTLELNAYLADALTLMRKAYFLVEPVEKDGRLILKVRKSSPFQVGDPEVAVRYIEATARFLEALAQEDSGLARELTRRTEATTRALLSTLDGESLDHRLLLRREAERAWHLSLIQTIALLYQQGFYHRRLEYVRWKAARGETDPEGRLTKRLNALPHPDMGRFNAAIQRIADTPLLTPEDYAVLKVGLDAVRAGDRLRQESFPGEMGDGTLLFDRERARQWGVRLEIIDGIYRLAAVRQLFEKAKTTPLPRHTMVRLVKLLRTAEEDLVGVMQSNRAEARHEWWDYWLRFPSHLQSNLSRRLRDLEDSLGDIDLAEMDETPEARGLRNDLERAIASTRRRATELAEESLRFQTEGFGGFRRLFEQEAEESARVASFLADFNQRLLPSYETFKGRLAHSPLRDDPKVRKLFKGWEKSLQEAAGHLDWARRNYERFNARRVGRWFLNHYLERAGIDPTEFPDSGPFF